MGRKELWSLSQNSRLLAMKRREALIGMGAIAAGGISARSGWCTPGKKSPPDLAGKIGIVSASLTPHFSGKGKPAGKLDLLDLPQLMNGELGLEVLDLNTMNLPAMDRSYLEKLKSNASKFGCIITNLKMNQRVHMASPNESERREARRVYEASIDAASILGCRWARPLPGPEKPDDDLHKAAFDHLASYAQKRGVRILIENFGWLMIEPDSLIQFAEMIGEEKVDVCVDTGNWKSNEIRYPALRQTFPLASTCDFKAKTMSETFGHETYDLERCFQIGWDAGFRGPWCLEHGNRDFERAKKELTWLRNQLAGWMEKQK